MAGTVHPQVRVLLDQMAAAAAGGGPTMREMSLDEARQSYQMLALLGGTGPEVESVEDRMIADVPVRVYRPAGAVAGVLVWIHGGGWVIGDLQTADPTCRELATRAGCTVVSVDYRRAPEDPFPAAVDDCWAVVTSVVASGEFGSPVAVGGDSAGGNLSAVVAQKAAASGVPLAMQALVYPVTDLQLGHPSMAENADGYLLTQDTMHWFREQYLKNEADVINPLASPLLAEDGALRDVAPALVITAEFDPLRDEGEAYAARLESAGVSVKSIRFDGQIHGFFGMVGFLDDAAVAVDEVASALRSALAVSR